MGRDDLLQGTLDLLVLRALASGALHGYQIVRRIQESSEDVLRVEEGALYPALHRLEARGWLSSSWGSSDNNRQAKFYRLTRTGRSELDAATARWERLSAAVGRVLKKA
ncbi:MAG: PadR family transcriptional regulator [Vicinamibacterales bacterium]